ncbi:P-loop containing nucleoside triphosphate hydrolase protein [Kockovaella imperatae]|uniref:p-loop containing nucleoside triphosphate hydrolase protein n=1 Tax=Kockovaella imperatae TaxID=4999 RepID=A0A1Y1UA94_9TREE|nr:P-loop containing nucleoside triphosphate hydrolase protein [Kockovaella imperatae]ORX33995.1 P-loop containing nucleoside triphosphate hydrolase protein [Kockovaella imperatae]
MLFKVSVLGDGGVGKTAITVQFTMSSFVETYDPTIEDCYRKQWVVDDQPCLLEVLDTAGQEEYTALRDQWIRDGEGFLIVYSICSRQTFDRIDRIIERILRVKDEAAASTPTSPHSPYHSHHHPYGAQPMTPRHRVPMVIIGNKKDLYQSREVSTEDGKALATRMGADFFETSAKSNSNVEQAFKSLVRQIKIAKGGYDRNGGGGGGSGGGLGSRQKKKKCIIL